jgi:hypothetical protein
VYIATDTLKRMIEKNELRLQYFIARLEQKIQEEYKVQQNILKLQIVDKLLSLYSHDQKGFEKALEQIGIPQHSKCSSNNEQQVNIVKHKTLKSKL